MNRILRALALAAAMLVPAASPATAQVFGQLTSANLVPMGGHEGGFYLNATDNLLGGLAQLRLSFYPGVDFGFQGGIARVTWQGVDRATVRMGTDVRFSLAHSGEGFPVDIAAGGGLGLESSDSYHVLTLMPSGVVSRSFAVGQNGSISPYLGVGISFARADAGTTNQTFLSLPLRLGADFLVMPGLRLTGELNIPIGDTFNDSFGLTTGVTLPF